MNSENLCVQEDTSTEISIAYILIALSMIFSGAVSMVTLASPSGIYSLINQIQLHILLPLLPAYFPSKVGDFIIGLDFSMLSFNFIPTGWITFDEDREALLEIPQDNTYLYKIGLQSKSSLMNILPMLSFLAILGGFHLVISWLYYLLLKTKESNIKCSQSSHLMSTSESSWRGSCLSSSQ